MNECPKRNAGFVPESDGRLPRHVAIDEALGRLDRAIDRLDELYDEVVGAPTPECGMAGTPSAGSLATFLDTGEERVSRQAERIHKFVEAMRASLF